MRLIWPLALVAISCAWNSAMAERGKAVQIGFLACSLSEVGDTATGDAVVAMQARDILCSFKLRNGVEETYTGKVQGVSLSAEQRLTLLWFVKALSATPPAPGLLQQTYAPDPKAPADQSPDMIGEVNSDI